MSVLIRKLRSARSVYDEDGFRGVARELRGRAPLRWLSRSYWLEEDHWWMGRIIELTGNRVRLEGCRFDVAHPAIPTLQKSLFLFDRYEKGERLAVRLLLDPQLPVVELGGSIGVLACVVNRRLRDPSRHVVVEANPELVPLLERNRDANGCRFAVKNEAIAYGADAVSFHVDSFLAGSVGRRTGRAITVHATSVRRVMDEAGIERCTLICDIEGEELSLVANELDVLRDRVSLLIMETHPRFGPASEVNEMLQRLRDCGFEERFRFEETYAFVNSSGVVAASR